MATRKDVAKLAGVSPTSVSYYINKSGYVSKEKAERIQKAIDELNYRPNLIARSLKIKSTNQLLLVCNEIRNPFHSELVYYTTKLAYEKGFTMLFTNVLKDKNYIEKLCAYQVGGVIFASDKVTVDQMNKVAKLGIPTIAITNNDWDNLDDDITQIKVDACNAIKQMVNLVISKGHKKIAYLSSCASELLCEVEGKTKGFIDAIKENNLEKNINNIIYNVTNSSKAYEEIKKRLNNKNIPTAYICANDAIAIGTLRAIHEAGLKVPDDIVITGFDNTEISKTSIPSLTTIDLSVSQISQIAIDIMMKKIEKKPQSNIIVTTKMVLREST